MDFVGESNRQYGGILGALGGHPHGASSSPESPGGGPTFAGMLYKVWDGVATITLNRPRRRNALSYEMYSEWSRAMKTADDDDNVRIIVLTGAGDYFTSGNDLANFVNGDMTGDMEEAVRSGVKTFRDLIEVVIDIRKPIIAAVNGPAIGIGVTILGLMDVVYASDKATFNTPFASLGQSPEGCSSYLFPKIMGSAKANEVLLFGKKLNAREANDCGLVAEVIPHVQFRAAVDRKIKQYSKLPPNTLKLIKNLIRERERDLLHRINMAECEVLIKQVQSEECMQAITTFFTKAKL